MKFAHSFSEELQSNEYPPEWLEAAIHYRQLKKCIKKVQKELAGLGLTADMLKMFTSAPGVAQTTTSGRITIMDELPGDIPLSRRASHDSQTSDDSGTSSGTYTEEFDEKEWLKKNQDAEEKVHEEPEHREEEEPPKQGITFSYWFDGTLESFVPKLVFIVDSEDGCLPINVNLASETRQALEKLVASQQQSAASTVALEDAETELAVLTAAPVCDSDSGIVNGHEHKEGNCNVDLPPLHVRRKRRDSQHHEVLVPLSSDLEFFRTLTSEITLIDSVESREEASIKTHIESLSDVITTVSKPSSFSRSSDLYAWREIFQLYAESGIFFSTRERDGHQQRTAEDADEKLKWFQNEMQRRGIIKSFRNKRSGGLLGEFIGVNMEILKLLRFREINKTAMRKILKKFDKRTALAASNSFAAFIASDPFISSQLAKVLCYTLSERLLSIIPQLDDYLCPICSSISVKPVRLSCSHVFCVRCLVKLQREHKKFCPICRGDVVMQADSANLDIGLLNFLRHYFPKEARIKQQENEREVTLEQFRALQSQGVGVGLRAGGCTVM